MILIIDRRDTVLRYARGALQLEVPEQKPRRIPVNQLEQLVVHGNPLIEASVWRALSAAGVAAVMLTPSWSTTQRRAGQWVGGAVAATPVAAPLRR